MLNIYGYLLSRLGTIRDREEGQGMIEYALLAALISVIAIVAITAVGFDVNGVFEDVQAALP